MTPAFESRLRTFPESFEVVNPTGHVGIVTLWTPVAYMLERLEQVEVATGPASPIAVIANLYGDGLWRLLMNLLYNPGITKLVVCGKDLSNSKAELLNFFRAGVLDSERAGLVRIADTTRLIPAALEPALFAAPPELVDLGSSPRALARAQWERALAPAALRRPARIERIERIELELPDTPAPSAKPSAAYNHNIIGRSLLESWRELVFVCREFGRVPHPEADWRRELLNVRVVITEPALAEDHELRRHGKDPATIRRYIQHESGSERPETMSYTFGNRLRAYFGVDQLAACCRVLRQTPASRHAYISLWDSAKDTDATSVPCLAGVSLRVYEGALTLSATFRVSNAFSTWIEDTSLLITLQAAVAEELGLPVGPLSIVAHTMNITDTDLARAAEVVELYQRAPASLEDPCGHIRITLDGGEIVVEQIAASRRVRRLTGSSARALERQLARSHAISSISHALYTGRELARAEHCLHAGRQYVQG